MKFSLDRDGMQKLLAENDLAVCRAVVVIHNNQTADEQNAEATINHNGRGFRPVHAKIGTSMAKQFLRNGRLTEKQINYWRRTDRRGNMNIGLYWRQLVEAAQVKQAAIAAQKAAV